MEQHSQYPDFFLAVVVVVVVVGPGGTGQEASMSWVSRAPPVAREGRPAWPFLLRVSKGHALGGQLHWGTGHMSVSYTRGRYFPDKSSTFRKGALSFLTDETSV